MIDGASFAIGVIIGGLLYWAGTCVGEWINDKRANRNRSTG